MSHPTHIGAAPKHQVGTPKGWKLIALALASWVVVILIALVAWSLVREFRG